MNLGVLTLILFPLKLRWTYQMPWTTNT